LRVLQEAALLVMKHVKESGITSTRGERYGRIHEIDSATFQNEAEIYMYQYGRLQLQTYFSSAKSQKETRMKSPVPENRRTARFNRHGSTKKMEEIPKIKRDTSTRKSNDDSTLRYKALATRRRTCTHQNPQAEHNDTARWDHKKTSTSFAASCLPDGLISRLATAHKNHGVFAIPGRSAFESKHTKTAHRQCTK